MSQEQIIVGGQAVIEGVMMRGPHSYAVAVRRADGQIVSTAERLPVLSDRYPVLRLPVLRGAAVLVHSMALGVKALNFSASVAFDQTDKQASGSRKKGTLAAAGSLVFALAFNVLLFIVLPLLLTNMIFVYGAGEPVAHEAGGAWYTNAWAWAEAALQPVRPSVLFNLVDGLIRMTFFLIMIVGFTFMRDIRRVFEYHGAEHKVVYTWEAGEALTVENARLKQRQHPRCGTSFLMLVLMVAVAAFSILKFDSLFLNFCVRVLMIPVIAGMSYEIIRASARTRALSIITRPGLWLQNLTTREPDDSQLEVAIFALEESLKLEPKPKALALAHNG